MSVVRPLLHQAQRLDHVVSGPDGRARVTSRLLQEAEGVVRTHRLLANASQTPGVGGGGQRLVQLHRSDRVSLTNGATDLLVSGISVSVIHQFLGVVEAALQEWVV